MRRVVITGMGVVSSIGANVEETTASLREGKSGITRSEDFAEHGFKCQVWARPTVNIEEALDRRTRRFMGEGAAWNYIAMQEAIDGAGLSEDEISNPMTGIIMGSGGPSRLQVVVPLDLSSSVAAAGAENEEKEESLCDKWRAGRREGLLSLASKAPEWNEELKTYTLEYNNRATLASVKNIQLVPEEHEEELLFQMGKVSDERFNLDWRAPLSAVQAFGIALSVFDSKMACSPAPPSLRAVMRVSGKVSELAHRGKS